MTPDEINNASNALIAATNNAAVASGKDINSDAGQLAAGLATGSSAQGGYNYARNVAPVVPVLTNQFVTAAKQGVFRNTLRDALNAAQVRLAEATSGYKQRQRVFQQKQAQKNRERYARESAGFGGYGGGGVVAVDTGAGTGVGDVNVAENSKQYIGNNDVRGRLAYLAANGDNNAKIALNFVGNDNKYYLSPLDPRYKEAIGALTAIGAVNAYTPGGGGGGGGW